MVTHVHDEGQCPKVLFNVIVNVIDQCRHLILVILLVIDCVRTLLGDITQLILRIMSTWPWMTLKWHFKVISRSLSKKMGQILIFSGLISCSHFESAKLVPISCSAISSVLIESYSSHFIHECTGKLDRKVRFSQKNVIWLRSFIFILAWFHLISNADTTDVEWQGKDFWWMISLTV